MELQSIKQRFGIIGNSAGLNNALSVAMRVAPTNLSTLIVGESGVGKEVFSQIIHQLSPRKHNKFIAVNCGAIPEGTIDSELFGHEKGAFTGASDQRKGYFETVNGGTIFLDEIGEMPLGTQARLLRVLESGEFIRVGASKVQQTDVRIVAATNVNLIKAVKNGKFREDLYYRLSTVPINIPPLRERKEDISLLFRKFCVDFGEKYRMPPLQLTNEAKLLLENHRWTGNIRELKHLAEQASVLATNKVIDEVELATFLPKSPGSELMIMGGSGNEAGDVSDREILYKLLFDMRKDVAELKTILFQLVGGNGLQNADFASAAASYSSDYESSSSANHRALPSSSESNYESFDDSRPVVIHSKNEENYDVIEAVEESLSIADMEKELIQKALNKHNGRRKDASSDLGISERTLYRKIKEYEIDC